MNFFAAFLLIAALVPVINAGWINRVAGATRLTIAIDPQDSSIFIAGNCPLNLGCTFYNLGDAQAISTLSIMGGASGGGYMAKYFSNGTFAWRSKIDG